ncbi:hypothetical protein LCGC14_0336260 [marine sediment metagenome]|uniref:Portal protein n=1 Tax=marine sediment metagenome TaxID=412755 RepID=A0A0F9W297_9ZZZZ
MLDTLLGLAPQASHDSANRSDHDDFWYNDVGHRTTAGIRVSEESAMTFATVWACVNVVAQTISTLPAKVFDRSDPKSRVPVDHPLNEILSTNHKGDALGLTVRETMQLNLELWGASYAEIITTQRTGELVTLIPIPSKLVKPEFDRLGKRIYVLAGMGENNRAIPESRMLVLPGLSFDGQNFLSPIAFNRASIGLGVAVHTQSEAFFGNSAVMGGVIQGAPGKGLSEEKGKQFIDSINQHFRGPRSAYGWMLLRENMEMKQFDIPTDDAMYLGTRQQTKIDICGMFRVPLSMIQDLSKGTFNNTEQMELQWVRGGVTPRCIRIETAFNEKFLSGTPLFLKHNVNALARGDMKTRAEFYDRGVLTGWLTRAEVRELEDKPFIEGSQRLLVPQNMAVLDEEGNAIPVSGEPDQPLRIEGPPEESDDGDAQAQASADLVEAFRPAVEDAAKRLATKEIKAVTNAVKRLEKSGDRDKFKSWACQFYSDHVSFSQQAMAPITESFSGAAGCDPVTLSIHVATDCANQAYKNLSTFSGETGLPANFSEHAGPFQVASANELTTSILAAFSQALRGVSDDQSN